MSVQQRGAIREGLQVRAGLYRFSARCERQRKATVEGRMWLDGDDGRNRTDGGIGHADQGEDENLRVQSNTAHRARAGIKLSPPDDCPSETAVSVLTRFQLCS